VLFWAITQRIAIIPYCRFGTNYRFHLQGSRISNQRILLGFLCCNRSVILYGLWFDNCSLLGFYTAYNDSLLPTVWDKLWVPTLRVISQVPFFLDCCILKDGPIGNPETSVTNCQSKLRNIPEEWRSHWQHGGSLKSLIQGNVLIKIILDSVIWELSGSSLLHWFWGV
jgi:hypothetical protein